MNLVASIPGFHHLLCLVVVGGKGKKGEWVFNQQDWCLLLTQKAEEEGEAMGVDQEHLLPASATPPCSLIPGP